MNDSTRNIAAAVKDITAINSMMDSAKPKRVKMAGETTAKEFGDEVKKFSEPKENNSPQTARSAPKHKALGRNVQEARQNDANRSAQKQAPVDIHVNKTSHKEKAAVKNIADDGNRIADESVALSPQYDPPDFGSDSGAGVQFEGSVFDSVNLNAQEHSPDVIDATENYESAIETAALPQVSVSISDIDGTEAVNCDENKPPKPMSKEFLEFTAQSIANSAAARLQFENIKNTLKNVSISNFTPPYDGQASAASGGLQNNTAAYANMVDTAQIVENVIKMLETMTQDGEGFDYSKIEEKFGDGAVQLLKKHEQIWQQIQSGQRAIIDVNPTQSANDGINLADMNTQNADVNINLAGANTDSAVVNTNIADANADNVNVNTNIVNTNIASADTANAGVNENPAGYIPQATNPAELNTASSSEIDWERVDEFTQYVKQQNIVRLTPETEIVSPLKSADESIPVDSEALRAMYKSAGLESVNTAVNKPQKKSNFADVINTPPVNTSSVNTSHSEQTAKTSVSDGVQIPVSYTELANENVPKQTSAPVNLTPEQPVPQQSEESAQSAQSTLSAQNSALAFSLPAADSNAASTENTASANLSLGMGETVTDVESADSPEPIQADLQANAAKAIDMTEKAVTSMSRVDQQAIIVQITERLQVAIRLGVHEMRLTLRPQELGEVRMNIRVEGDQVTARMVVESEQVKSIVEKHFQQLKDALEQQNLHAAKLSVDVGTDSDRHQMWREMSPQMANARRSKFGGSENGDDGDSLQNDNLVTSSESDTGRRFGNNTFEYFV